MTIQLSKGQTVNLSKDNPGLKKVVMGLGWDAAKPKGFFANLLGSQPKAIDLDASCLVFDSAKTLVDVVWFRNLHSDNGSIVHTGDNRTGDGDGDDEQIIVDLTGLPADAQHLVFTVNSFLGQTFNEVENATCRMTNEKGAELCRFTLAEKGRHTGVLMAVVTRKEGAWTMKAVGAPMDGTTAQDMAGPARRYI